MNKKLIGAGAAGLLLLLAGCSNGGNAKAPETLDSKDLLVTTPAPTAELDRIVWNNNFGEPPSIDPIKAADYPASGVVSNLCESLFQIQPDFSIKPHLAKSVTNTGNTSYVYELQDGVTFWDGKPMTADDVVFSLKRHLDPKEISYWASSVTANIASVEKTGPSQVTVKLKTPDATFNNQLATPVGAVVEKAQREKAGVDYGNPGTGVMCTGPYSVGNWKQGASITLERYDGYWKADKKAKTKQVEIQFITDPASITNALATGAVDGSYDVPLSAVGQLSKSSTGQLFHGKSMQNMAIISTGTGTLGDPAVRKALTLATDREAIARTVYEGTSTAAQSLVPAGGWAYGADVFEAARKNLPAVTPNLEEAKKAIKDAKVDLSKPIKIVYPIDRTFYADIISEFANAGAKLGLKVEPSGVPGAQFGAFFSDPKARAGADAFVTTNYMNVADPLIHLAAIAGPGGMQNYSGFSDPKITELLDKARATSGDAERAKLTVEAEALIMDKEPWLPVVDSATRLYMNKRVTGAPASFVYLYYPWAAELGGTGE
ncbi:ABC transporter substrate-binding protein [Arthrobacter cupressi]|uniref:Peptide/nickel transport system substrate-binding protein n=1 Tax=Arthrobacter cupressi TaxID=1045773 RepID=A0A1G8N7G8_9MICC|nr:ABC transporter substrate-binding protein [Arthrobacter cupressi]NYD78325.1 peptide/nickel transport system substrate-binding protein [Arthrobacter cupressi]SDI76073.1 peptide/nickel transport system substrate-binding protein [Arthrobacter cupressi]